MLLENKVAIITGASRGIGRRIAEVFAENGALIVLNYYNSAIKPQDLAKSLKDQVQQLPLAIKADVSTSKGISKIVRETLKRYGHIDILVNNAGITIRSNTLAITEQDWDRVQAVNLKGPFLCSKAVVPHMLQAKSGVILNIASIRGITGSKNSSHYAISKAGIIAMTKSFALEFAPYIRVNAIAPGYTFTDLHSHLDQKEIGTIETSIPLKRFGTVDDIANTALFLASEEARYITGETIIVAGGLVMQ